MTAPNSQEGTEKQPALKGLKAAEIALSNPLEAETRKARLYLLGVSLVSITIVQTGLVPQEIATLGITFEEADQRSLLSILALVIVYFTLAFAIYGISDFLAWRYAYSNVHWAEVQAEAERKNEASARASEEFRRKFDEAESKRKEAEGLQRKVSEGVQSLPEELRTKVEQILEGSWQRERRDMLLRRLSSLSTEKEIRQVIAASDPKYVAENTLVESLPEGLVENLPEELRTKVEQIQEANSQTQEANSQLLRINIEVAAAGTASQIAAETLGDPKLTLPLAPTVSWVRALFEFLLPLLVSFYAIYALLSA